MVFAAAEAEEVAAVPVLDMMVKAARPSRISSSVVVVAARTGEVAVVSAAGPVEEEEVVPVAAAAVDTLEEGVVAAVGPEPMARESGRRSQRRISWTSQNTWTRASLSSSAVGERVS